VKESVNFETLDLETRPRSASSTSLRSQAHRHDTRSAS
jgi:hypothetical protein